MIKNPNQQFPTANKFYKLQARINKCYINCQKDKMLYAVCLRFGPKMSQETTKKHPINYTMIDFNSTIYLTLSKNELISAYKCEILLLKFDQLQQQQKRQIIGISSIHITDLKQQNFRKFRLINNYDKCAIIQASIKLIQLENHRNKFSQHNQIYMTPSNMTEQNKSIARQNKKIVRHIQESQQLLYKGADSQQLKQKRSQKNETSKIKSYQNGRFNRTSKQSFRQQKLTSQQKRRSNFDQPRNQFNLYPVQNYITANDSSNSRVSSIQQNGFDMNLTKKHQRDLSQARSYKTLESKDNQKFTKVSQNLITNQINQGGKFCYKNTKTLTNQNQLQGISQSIRFHSRRKISSSQEGQYNYNNVPTSIKSTFEKQVQTLTQDIFQKHQLLKAETLKYQTQKNQLSQQIAILKKENQQYREKLYKEKNKKSFTNHECQTQESDKKSTKEKNKALKLSLFHLPQLFINNQNSVKHLKIWPEISNISLLLKSNKVLHQNFTNTLEKKTVQNQTNTVKLILCQQGSNTNSKQLSLNSSFKFDIIQKYHQKLNIQEFYARKYQAIIKALEYQKEEWLNKNSRLQQDKQELQRLLNQSNKTKELKLFKPQCISIHEQLQENKKMHDQCNRCKNAFNLDLQNKNQFHNNNNVFPFQRNTSKIQQKKQTQLQALSQSHQIQDYFNRTQSARKNLCIQRTISLCLKPKHKSTISSILKQDQLIKVQIKKDQNSFSKFKIVGYISATEKKHSEDHSQTNLYKPKHVQFKDDIIEEVPNESVVSPTLDVSQKTCNFNFFQMIKPVQQEGRHDKNTFNIVTHGINGNTQEIKYDGFNQSYDQQSEIVNESIIISINSIKQQNQQSQDDKRQAKWSFVQYRKLNDEDEAQKFYRQNRLYNINQLQLKQKAMNFQQKANENLLAEYRKIKNEFSVLKKQIEQKEYISNKEYKQIMTENIKLDQDIKILIEQNKSLYEKNVNLALEISKIQNDYQKLIKKNEKDVLVIKQMKKELFNLYDKQSQTKKIDSSRQFANNSPILESFANIPFTSSLLKHEKNVKRKDSIKSDCTFSKGLSQKSLLSGFLGNFENKEDRSNFRKQSINLNLKNTRLSSFYKNSRNIEKTIIGSQEKEKNTQKSIQSKAKSNNNPLFTIQKQLKSQIIGPKKGFKLQKRWQNSPLSKVEAKDNSFTYQNSNMKKIIKDSQGQSAQIQVDGFQILDFMSTQK